MGLAPQAKSVPVPEAAGLFGHRRAQIERARDHDQADHHQQHGNFIGYVLRNHTRRGNDRKLVA